MAKSLDNLRSKTMEKSAGIQERFCEVGLGNEDKYRFLFGPNGLPISASEKNELEQIGQTSVQFIKHVDDWYKRLKALPGGSWLLRLMGKGVPDEYLATPWVEQLPFTMMVDTIYTATGWRIVEIDATNRNAMGYPAMMRYLYNLPLMWQGLAEAWNEGGWAGSTQIMGNMQRYYKPYFQFFLNQINGRLVPEPQIAEWLWQTTPEEKLLDIPVMFHSKDLLPHLLRRVGNSPIAIPPKHVLSSKATLSLLWEETEFSDEPVREFVPKTRLLARSRPLPENNFLVKLLQSNGAHGVFLNDHELLTKLHQERKAQGVWQEQLPVVTRHVEFLDENGNLKEGDFYVRISLFVNQQGRVVDADATCSPNVIVHGSKQSIMTVPVLI